MPGHTGASDRVKACGACREVNSVLPRGYCKACYTVYMRVEVYKKQMDLGSPKTWFAMARDRKVAFFKEAHGMAPDDFRALMRLVILQEYHAEIPCRRGSTGDFLDSPKLCEKYKNNPEQLKYIKENTRTITCPVNLVRLYEDMNVACGYVQRHTAALKRFIELSTEWDMRAKARLKTNNLNRAVASPKSFGKS